MSKYQKTIGHPMNTDPSQFLIDLKHKFQSQNKKYTIHSIKCNSDTKYVEIQKKRQSSPSQEKKLKNQLSAQKPEPSDQRNQLAILQQQLDLQMSNQGYIEQLHRLIDSFNIGGESYLLKLENIFKDYFVMKQQYQDLIDNYAESQKQNLILKQEYQLLQSRIKNTKECVKQDAVEQSFQSTIDQEQMLASKPSVVDFRINLETQLQRVDTQQEDLMKIFQMFQNSESVVDLCNGNKPLEQSNTATPRSQKFVQILNQSITPELLNEYFYNSVI